MFVFEFLNWWVFYIGSGRLDYLFKVELGMQYLFWFLFQLILKFGVIIIKYMAKVVGYVIGEEGFFFGCYVKLVVKFMFKELDII